MKLEDLRVYQQAIEIGEKVWKIVMGWDYFQKDTIGKQLVKAADSIAANISEGYGRYHFKENKNFNYYSRGSLYEMKTWLVKAHNRELIQTIEFQEFMLAIESIGKMLNNYINSIGQVNEPEVEYQTNNYLPNTND